MIEVKTDTRKAMTDLKLMLDQDVRLISQEVLTQVKRFTPVRSGRARGNWRLQQTGNIKSNSGNAAKIYNNLPYVARLNEGYSKQSPEGITRPAFRAVSQRQKRKE